MSFLNIFVHKIIANIKSISTNFIPKVIWLAQVTPSKLSKLKIQQLQDMYLDQILTSLHIYPSQIEPIKQRVIAQLQLSKKNGGFGIINVADLCEVFRISTLVASLPLVAKSFPSSSPLIPELHLLITHFRSNQLHANHDSIFQRCNIFLNSIIN